MVAACIPHQCTFDPATTSATMEKIVTKLTDREAKNATRTVSVGLVPGLILRVTPTNKTFVLRIRTAHQDRWITLGSLNDMTVAQARKTAQERLHTIAQNPTHKVAAPKRAALYTVRQMLEEYIESETRRGRWDSRGRQTHADKAYGWIKNHMSHEFLSLPAAKLTPEHIRDEFGHLFLTMRSTPVKIVGEIKRAWSWSVAHKKIPFLANPAASDIVVSFLPAKRQRPRQTHYPYLAPEQIPEFVTAVVAGRGVAPRVLLFCMLTCSRIGNVLSLTWPQIDLDEKVMSIPRQDMKVKGLSFDRVTPLSPWAIDILRGMPRFPLTRKDEPDYVFRDFVFDHTHISETTLANFIRRLNHARKSAGLSTFHDPQEVDAQGRPRPPTPHGLSRASFETWANSPARYKHEIFDANMVEACLDHFNPAYGGAYMREYPLEDMRHILDLWGAYCYSATKDNNE